MANQSNFKTDISVISKSYTKYTLSRIIENLSDNLLETELPAEFPSTLNDVAVQISIYSLFDNSLIYADTISNDTEYTPIYINKFIYQDNSSRNLLYVDFAQLPNLFLPTGTYQVTFDFYVNEIGSYDERNLKVTKISPSRYEVELEHTNPTPENLEEVQKFVEHGINAKWVLDATKQIFNQIGSQTLDVPASDVTITGSNVLTNLDSGSTLIDYGFAEDSLDGKPGIYTLTQQILDIAYSSASKQIQRDIDTGTGSFTATRLYGYVTSSIREAYDTLLIDELTNPSKYRFDLI